MEVPDVNQTGSTQPIQGPISSGVASFGEKPGDWIGPYKLLEVIGEGGFGTVWLAERREPMVQRVALKIIKPGMDSKGVIARFDQERQALAVMDHPNVAKVFDGGVTGQGRPYFVMEHVQGEPITTFCDRQAYTIKQRLSLFTDVCEAVQHAHHKGIIHRDIKPSNVLVAIKDGQAIAKVIDFGVAKAISHTLTDRTIFTESGQLIGTPEYMSPEQAEMGATDIDTRTDVYSLGVVLYELVSGMLPFDSRSLRAAGYDAIRKVLREQDAPKPSTRLSTADDATGEGIAKRRVMEREQLARELRRELDWIPLKALRKDRTQRYDTPADLAKDIRRYLDGEPLEAGPESAGYRVRKFVRRNRGAVIALATITALGLVSTSIVIKFRSDAQRATEASLVSQYESLQRERLELDRFAVRMGVAPTSDRGAGERSAAPSDAASRGQAARLLHDQVSLLREGIEKVESLHRTTLDPRIQEILHEELSKGVDSADAAGGRAVAIDPFTGWVIGAVCYSRNIPDLVELSSLPPSESDDVKSASRVRTVSPSNPQDAFELRLTDGRVSGLFEPGGMLRPFVWAICTDLEVAGNRTRVDTSGGRRTAASGMQIDDVVRKADQSWGEVLVNSSNVGLTKATEQIGYDELHSGLAKFGFGVPPGQAFPVSSSGTLTPLSNWSAITQTSVTLGTEIGVTPFQLVRAFAAFAQPYGIAPRIPELTLEMRRPPSLDGRPSPISLSTANRARQLLHDLSINLELRLARENNPADPSPFQWQFSMFGVSGTSRILTASFSPSHEAPVRSNQHLENQYVSGFLAAGPVGDPRLVILVLIDDPGPESVRKKTHGGAQRAGPVCRRAMERSLKALGVQP